MLTARKLTTPAYYSDARPLAARVVSISSGNITLTPAAATLTLTAETPGVVVGNNVYLSPSRATLTITPETPTVTATNNIQVSPSSASLVLTGATPTVTFGGSITLTPAAATLTFTPATPNLFGAEAAAPSGLAFLVSPNWDLSPYIIGTLAGKAVRVTLDWDAKTEFNDTSVSSVAWAVASGSATLSGVDTEANLTSAIITTASAGNSTIKATATFADGQIDIALIKVKASAIT